jgi:hydroxymethylglutaryl-CoA reductase (NADPH)
MTKRSADERPLELVPRFARQGYQPEKIAARRAWVEKKTGVKLEQVAAMTMTGEALRGNIENPIGAAQVPIGVAGPLLVKGEYAHGVFYLPLATTEGALVRSYERGMVTASRAGGVTTRVVDDSNQIAPVFVCADVAKAHQLASELPDHLETLQELVKTTTAHGALLRLECHPLGRQVYAKLVFAVGDAHGMNLIARAAEAVRNWVATRFEIENSLLFSGLEAEKKAAATLLAGGKGKRVLAGVSIPPEITRSHLHVEPEQMAELWRLTVLGAIQAGTLGYNGHAANLLTALGIACGQDVANVANAAVAITTMEVLANGDLHVSVTLPSLTFATVGGGTALGTARECLEMMDCYGSGRAKKLAEITAAAVLAGELSIGAALATGEFVAAHEQYGRNRPAG